MVQRSMAVCLLIFALLQLNDSDGWIWAVAYLLPALGLWFSTPEGRVRWLIYTLMIGYLGTALWLWPSKFYGVSTMDPNVPQIELARESLGLLICVVGWALSLRQRQQ